MVVISFAIAVSAAVVVLGDGVVAAAVVAVISFPIVVLVVAAAVVVVACDIAVVLANVSAPTAVNISLSNDVFKFVNVSVARKNIYVSIFVKHQISGDKLTLLAYYDTNSSSEHPSAFACAKQMFIDTK